VKKTITIVITSVALLILLFSIVIMFMGSRAIQKNEPLYVFGYSFTVVAPTGSMIGDQPDSLDNYDIAIIRQGEFEEVEIGMVIVFQTNLGANDQILVIHRVVGIHPEGGFETKGDNNPSVDQNPVTEENFQGIYVSKITFLRPISQLAANGKNVIFLVLIIVLAALLISEIINIIKHVNDSKTEEMVKQTEAEIDALKALEKEKIYQEILNEEQEKMNKKQQ
jgi:signal peptidase I